MKGLFAYLRKPFADPQSGNEAFIPMTSLPLQSIQGTGVFTHGQMDAYQSIQFVHMKTVPTDALSAGGQFSGSQVSQPLTQHQNSQF